jgi:hypothetical protein
MHTSGNLIPEGELIKCQPVGVYYQDKPVTVALQTWMRTNICCANTRVYWDKHPEMNSGIDIDWECMASITKGHRYLYKIIAFMKTLWSSYAYNHKRMMWKLIPPCDNKCIFCGNIAETQHHVLHDCRSVDLQNIKKEMYNEIAEALQLTLTPKEGTSVPNRKQKRCEYLKEWIPQMVPKLWSGEMKPPTTNIAALDSAIEKLHGEEI